VSIKNGVTARAWKHIDSFARARNQAFAQGTGDWLVWADCDDNLAEAEGLHEKLAQVSDDVLMIRCPYDVRGTGKRLPRERFIRRSAFAAGRIWHHDVHENLLLLPNDRHEDWPTPVWHHLPQAIKQDNRKRNLAILGRSVGEAATQYFYIHQEHYCAGNKSAAEQFGKIAISFPNLDDSFRYEVLLNLARISASRRESLQLAMSAHGVFPWCREAIASIIMLAFERNDGKRASWWASHMLKLPEPAPGDRPWTHEAKWYGWAGHDLAARAFRLAGQTADADALQLVYHKHALPDDTAEPEDARQLYEVRLFPRRVAFDRQQTRDRRAPVRYRCERRRNRMDGEAVPARRRIGAGTGASDDRNQRRRRHGPAA
jgi:hypothetical protein